jgi:hypothetical protein
VYWQLAEFRNCGTPHHKHFTEHGQYGDMKAYSVPIVLIVVQLSLPLVIIVNLQCTSSETSWVAVTPPQTFASDPCHLRCLCFQFFSWNSRDDFILSGSRNGESPAL